MKFKELTKQETDEICKLFLDHCGKEHKITSVTWDGIYFVFQGENCTHFYEPPEEVTETLGEVPQVHLKFSHTVRYGEAMVVKPSKPSPNQS